MKNFQCLATGIDMAPLMNAILRRPALWREDTYLRDYPQGPFANVESIMLRFPVKGVKETEEELRDHLSTHDQHESIDYPALALLPMARPVIFGLMRTVEGERLGRVMINKVAPGGVIYPHADTPAHVDYYSRYHVVLHSRPGVAFRCGDEKVYMATGEAWWFNNALEHEVVNNSADDRIHMVIDIKTSR